MVFYVIAYLGAIAQLTGIFFFTNWLTRSRKGAYLAMLVTALSLFNVKFLLFDIYRPDHLSYALILLQTYFAFKKKFLPLLITTIIASQIREFNIIPLIAYLISSWYSEERSVVIKQIFFSAIFMLPAIIFAESIDPCHGELSNRWIVTGWHPYRSSSASCSNCGYKFCFLHPRVFSTTSIHR